MHGQIGGSSARRPSTEYIAAEHRAVLYIIVHADPWLYLDEIVQRLNDHPMVLTRIYKLHHVFRQLALDGFSLTKMRKFAAEKDERLRTRYWEVMTQEVWFPETPRTSARDYLRRTPRSPLAFHGGPCPAAPACTAINYKRSPGARGPN